MRTDLLEGANRQLIPKYVKIDRALLGDFTVIPAVSGRKLRILALFLTTAGTVTVKFQSGAAGTDITGPMPMILGAPLVLPLNVLGWFETAAGSLLNVNMSLNVQVSGGLTYVEA